MSNKEVVWTTKDGYKIPIPDIDDRHLLNIHRMLCQQVEDEKWYSGIIGTIWAPRGEMAQEAFEEEYTHTMNLAMKAKVCLTVINKEVEKRKLKPLALKDPYKPMPTPIKSTVMDYGMLYEFDIGDKDND